MFVTSGANSIYSIQFDGLFAVEAMRATQVGRVVRFVHTYPYEESCVAYCFALILGRGDGDCLIAMGRLEVGVFLGDVHRVIHGYMRYRRTVVNILTTK